MERCIVCNELAYTEDEICEDCERVLELDLTIDLAFELRAIGLN